MNYVSQPRNSKVCGQACVAMLAGVTLADAIAAVGHKRGTRYADLRRGLAAFNLTLGAPVLLRGALPEPKALQVVAVGEDPRAVVRLRRRRSNWGGHWIVVAGQRIWDPAPQLSLLMENCGGVALEEYTSLLTLDSLYYTSYALVTR